VDDVQQPEGGEERVNIENMMKNKEVGSHVVDQSESRNSKKKQKFHKTKTAI